MEVVSVHTPHVTLEGADYLTRTDSLADTIDATLIVHSQYLHHTHVDELETLGFESDYGYENNPGASVHHLRNTILERGHDLVLDNAHLYMAEPDYRDDLESLLEEYRTRIPVVHPNDSTALEDGLAFGEGGIDLEWTVTTLEKFPIERSFSK